MKAYHYSYFPTLHQAVIFRNWGTVSAEKLAEVLCASLDEIRSSAADMGLNPDVSVDSRWKTRGFITIIRQNWQLLPEEQLLKLLDWTPEQLALSLKEDDFLSVKLGDFKPECDSVTFRPLTEDEKKQTVLLRNAVLEANRCGTQKPFEFLDILDKPEIPERRAARAAKTDEIRIDETWRFVSEGFGDALAFAIDRFTNRMLARWGTAPQNGSKVIHLARVEWSDAPRETHAISVNEQEIVINGAAPEAILRALTALENTFETAGAPVLTAGETRREPRFEARILYPYAATFGDIFSDPDSDPLQEGLLDRLLSAGVNGLWLHVVLYQMVPYPFDPKVSEGWEKRIQVLNRLVARAKKYGIGIYLYINEPRAMPLSFFDAHPELKGHEVDGYACLCTSRPEVQDYLRNAMRTLFTYAPDLAGVFTITMSENWTNCYSRSLDTNCPVCAKRKPYEITAEVNRAIEEGVHAAKPDANVFVWNWAWKEETGFPDDRIEEVISLLPQNVFLQATSESGKPFTIGGVNGSIRDYSISIPGPGEMARQYWRAAAKRGMRRSAKIQVNSSWECGAMPYFPVMDLVREHMDNLAKENVTALFLSWTLGGYPSENLRRVSRYFWKDTQRESVERTAVEAAQSIFSEAFREFPFSVQTLYNAPQQVGPANPLLYAPSGWKSTMVGIPYDDLESWRSIYPADVFEHQFEKLCERWMDGIRLLQKRAPEETELINIAQAMYNHYESCRCQIKYVRLRDNGGSAEEICAVVREELALINSQIECISKDSRIGFEASNHYFYTKQTLLEAAAACAYILNKYNGSEA